MSTFRVPLNCAFQGGAQVTLQLEESFGWRRLKGLLSTTLDSSWHTRCDNERKVVFFKIDDQRARNGSNLYCTGVVIRTASLLEHGYQYCVSIDGPTLNLGAATISSTTVTFQDNELQSLDLPLYVNGNFLHFTTNSSQSQELTDGADDFVLRLYRSDKRIAVELFTSPYDGTLRDEHGGIVFASRNSPWFGYPDRISKRLKTGKSVSVALRRVPLTEGANFEIDVIIDSDGKLLWPDAPHKSDEDGMK